MKPRHGIGLIGLIAIAVMLGTIAFVLLNPPWKIIRLKGMIKEDLSFWSPELNKECGVKAYVNLEDKKHYLDGLCKFQEKQAGLFNKELIIVGFLEEKEFEVPVKNGKTVKKTLPVINVQEIKPVEAEQTV
jgi:hypothetical protein